MCYIYLEIEKEQSGKCISQSMLMSGMINRSNRILRVSLENQNLNLKCVLMSAFAGRN